MPDCAERAVDHVRDVAAVKARSESPEENVNMTRGQTSTVAWAPNMTVETCWLCGIRLPEEQMVPDGGNACADVRWYCQDTQSCTRRWTTGMKDARPSW